MKKPTEDQMLTAIAWLEANEGEGDEAEACKAVAEWLELQVAKSRERSMAKEHGCTVAELRRVIEMQ